MKYNDSESAMDEILESEERWKQRAETAEAQVEAVREIVRWSTKYDHGDTAVDTVMAVQKALEQKP